MEIKLFSRDSVLNKSYLCSVEDDKQPTEQFFVELTVKQIQSQEKKCENPSQTSKANHDD